MYFPTVLVFTAIIMSFVFADTVEAQYGFPIYYRIARRFDGGNQDTQDFHDGPSTSQLITDYNSQTLETNVPSRPIPPTHDGPSTSQLFRETLERLNNSRITPTKVRRNNNILNGATARSGSEEPIENRPRTQTFLFRPSWSTSWTPVREDKENWSEEEKLMQQLLLKIWLELKKENDSGRGKEDFHQ